jgi:HAE1 family hydrophobic/amphiphilic exporter-1
MLVMSLVVLGTFSFRGLGVDLFPKADPATVSVALTLPGASPDEMSTTVIEPMEEALSGVSGIDEMQARIAEGRGQITVRFVLERNINDASNDVREKVASAIRNMPAELLPPVITKVDPDADPVMSLIVSSKAMSLRTLTELTDKQIARVIQTVNGVGEVSLSGGRAREIHIVVDVEKLNSYGLSMGEVRDALVAENVEIPGGTIEQGKGQLLLRTMGRVDASEDFNGIVIATKNGTPIRIADIGRAEDSFERPTTAVWLGDTPAVMLDVRRAMGENTVAVIEGVRARLATIERSLPTAVKITVIRDDSRFIYASISSLEEHLIFGALFATIVVMFFIRNIRAVIISALAIPASIISSFTLMNIMGFTLNNMTLLAITLAVGIVIDDAIVVLENIFRYIEEKNCSPYEAAIQGTREVALAVMATTLSLVVIFLPIAFMDGYAKRFINPFGWTMAFAILVSMLVSFTLTPMLSSRFLKLSDADADRKTKEGGFFHWLDEWYTGRVNWALDHSTAVIAISVVTVLLTIPLNRMVGREFVPNEDMGEWTVHADRRYRRGGGHRAIRRRVGARGVVVDPHPFPLSSQADRRPHQHAGADHYRDAAAAGRASGLPPEHHLAQRARQRRGDGRVCHLREHPRSGSRTDCRLFQTRARRGAERAQYHGVQNRAQRLESRGPRRRRSQAGRRPWRPHVDDREHLAARGLG